MLQRQDFSLFSLLSLSSVCRCDYNQYTLEFVENTGLSKIANSKTKRKGNEEESESDASSTEEMEIA